MSPTAQRLAGSGLIGAGLDACLWLRALDAGPSQEIGWLAFMLLAASFTLTLAGVGLAFSHGSQPRSASNAWKHGGIDAPRSRIVSLRSRGRT